MHSLALIIFAISEKKAFEHFHIGSNVLYKLRVFCSDMRFKMAATAGLSLTLDPMGKMFQNDSSLKPLGQLKPNCPAMIIGRFSIKFLFFIFFLTSVFLSLSFPVALNLFFTFLQAVCRRTRVLGESNLKRP
jgi:hypothetical protein